MILEVGKDSVGRKEGKLRVWLLLRGSNLCYEFQRKEEAWISEQENMVLCGDPVLS